MSDKDTSTLKGYADSAAGTVQSAFGNIAGKPGEESKGEARKAEGEVTQDASHTLGKLGPYNVSGSGGFSEDDPRRTEGSWNQTIGSGKETVGNALGLEDLKREGREQNAAGRGQEAQGQLSDFGSGIKDRVTGTVGGAAAGLTGDRDAQQRYQQVHDDGKTAQRSAESDIQKQDL